MNVIQLVSRNDEVAGRGCLNCRWLHRDPHTPFLDHCYRYQMYADWARQSDCGPEANGWQGVPLPPPRMPRKGLLPWLRDLLLGERNV